jgi:pSer/pThr/pTyr-binding forkhead associated (FHA) protein
MVSMTGDIYPVERVINLSPDHPTIEIGRASKSLNKGIVSAEDNAWFDSPVMSRAHAKLTLDINDNVRVPSPSDMQIYANLVDPQSVTLVDVGSMHGTLVNNQPLKVNERTTLRDNDIVVFGTQVTRGSETIPPCAFRVNYEYSPYK